MSKKLLIDALHPEETRVALIDEKKRLIEYDIDTLHKQTIKSNIYLAKIMRVEPSLQAAFVEYGGNRHGFLAFSEIHPDYFRIPVSDREVLSAKLEESEIDPEELEATEEDTTSDETTDTVSTIAGESVDHSDEDEVTIRRPALHKMYKIQEVIHKNQIVLIQVNKEERGQKGAALTTYLSLAGRYCVLMPNSPQAGGISRKISNVKERKKMREVLEGLNLPNEMGMIIRTAGRGRTKTEIKRDANYLLRQWSEIRDETLNSIAPSLIYQEDSIIKRVIRDQYDKDTQEILIEGDDCYKSAKAFMKKLLPSHAKNVKQYKNDRVPIFIEHNVEDQIEKMHEPTVMLPSGGSIVINPTEALVSIDINSGRSTKERHIEETALNTNLEAAVEIARQVRMRDLAGLIVIDFIDMDDRRYTSQVERKVREAFKNDRARVQMGKISPFGLLELSRQRMRPSMLETSSSPCPHCHATGYIRSTESMALFVLRSLEEEGIAQRSEKLKAIVPTDVAFFILNEKRDHLALIEKRHNLNIVVFGDPSYVSPDFKMIQLQRRVSNQNASAPETLADNTDNQTSQSESKSSQQRQKRSRPAKKMSQGRKSADEKTGEASQSRPQRKKQTDSKKRDGKEEKSNPSHANRSHKNDRSSGQKQATANSSVDQAASQNADKDANKDTKHETAKESGQDKSRSGRRRPQRRQGKHDKRPTHTKHEPKQDSKQDQGQQTEALKPNSKADVGEKKETQGNTKESQNNSTHVKKESHDNKSATSKNETANLSADSKKEAPQPPAADKKDGRKRRSWLKKLLD